MLDWFLPRDASSARLVRAHLRGLRDAVPQERLDEAQLLTTELVSNAVRHGGGPGVHVTAQIGASELCVGVADDGAGRPEPRAASALELGGRGLALVDALATRWGVQEHPEDGKTVWFALAW